MNPTDIDYLDYSWNPLAMRCTKISEGCEHCWHLRMTKRMAANPVFTQEVRDAYAGKGPPVLIESRLAEPLRRRKPTRIGVQFMGDLFHEDVPFSYISKVFDAMGTARQHTFLVLTKRPERMYRWMQEETANTGEGYLNEGNVWLGVTAENQARADERVPLLLQCPAAVRFVSIEPMLAPINIAPWTEHSYRCHVCAYVGFDFGEREDFSPICPRCGESEATSWAVSDADNTLDYVIAGGETGPGARPAHVVLFRSIRDQCVASDTPFFLKHRGCFLSLPEAHLAGIQLSIEDALNANTIGAGMVYVGKEKAGYLLDGKAWRQFPSP